MPALTDQGEYIDSESNLYRVLHGHGQNAWAVEQGQHRNQASASAPGSRSESGLELGQHDLPTSMREIWLSLNMVIDGACRRVVAWAGDEREDPSIAADLVRRTYQRERISEGESSQ